jgi:hypothetical protein
VLVIRVLGGVTGLDNGFRSGVASLDPLPLSEGGSMRKLVLAVMAAVAVAGIASPVAQAKPHKARTHRAHKASSKFTVHVTIPTANVFTNPPASAGQPASDVLFVVGGSGTFAGHGTGQVYFTLAGVTQEVAVLHAVLAFSNGTLNLEGLTTQTVNDPERYAITGGTEKFRGARGEIIQSNETQTDAVDAFDLTVRFVH